MAGLGVDGVLCGGVYLGAGGRFYDAEDGRVTGMMLTSAVSPNYPVNFDIGRRARQQAADVVGGGLRGRARELFLNRARTDPETAASAKRIADYHNPRPQPAGPTGIEQAGNAIKPYVLPVVGGLTGCATGAKAGAEFGFVFALTRAVGAAVGCLVNGGAGVLGGDLAQPHRTGQPPSYP